VAEVAMGGSSLTPSPVFIDGESAIDMEVRPLKSANPIDVARVTKAQLAKINKELPAGTKMVLTYDQSQFIKAAIDESFKTVAEAIFLVILVVLIFLGSVRAATIPIITIPVCTIAVFSLIALFGFTINVMTLLAIVLAIGLVVDDAIVVVENIYRYIEKGLSPLKAAFKGSREIVFAVIAMTLTLVAVYIPLSFNQGFTAIVFREFAFTLAGAVLISGFVALTLSPMMCAKLLRPTEKTSKLMLRIEAGLTRMATSYKALLTQVLARRHWVILLLLLLSIAGYGLYLILNQQLIPKEDIGYFETSITAPPGANVNYMEKNMRQLDQVFAKTPQIQHYATFVIPNGSTNFVTVQPWGKRNLTTQQLLDQLGPKVNSEISGISVTFNVPDPVNYGTTTSGFNLKLTSLTDDTDSLKTASDKVLKALQKYPGLTNLKNSLTFNEQQFSLQVNRDLAARLGVDMADISSTLSTLLGGVHVTNLDQGADSYAVRVQVAKKYLANFDVMQNLYVKTAKGDMVPLASLVTLTPTVGQAKIERYDRMDAASITGYISPSYTASDVQKEVMKVVPPLLNDNNQSYAFAGVVKQLQESQGDMLAMFILALLFIYLILAAQFESFIDPLIILLTVPLCVVGALAVLKGVGGTLNLYTNIGLLTLIGLVTKHGILIVQFANQLVRQGQEAKTAVLNAAAVRFRPILMTSSTMIFGALPLALASGPGSVGRSQIGWVLVSGLALGTLFSLFVVPAAYTYLGGKSVKLNWRWWQPEGNTNPNN
jgi:hydrophobe/amphiphile efflux-1 (HAE1) family protein